MPLKTEEIEEPVLNLTPMIDIVLLLIIFFMVGTKFSDAERQFEINLPTVSDAMPLTTLPDELVVSVSEKGELTLDSRPVTLAELQQELTTAAERYADQAVIIRGDAQGSYQNVMDVLAACHRAGLHNLSLANRLNREDGS
ncbi:MAG: ExbD/TolR family protein [Rubinisphaera brasiliensis]|uniref:Biopolymer transport protein ExbD/TolR n=1 Tax=Rubinisphaera brasiliensis (strain ATCC 49424 / DSM 5305 / JCM 21570 / IAM 15109 / NBRC 103401 / IFAM 1448) TaxID=756272 RepID=F0SKX4_RUBBR|nr:MULTISPECIES: biopolymer transporter ExbD [Rubinisphaera]ADY59827.1 Biopolymer transport protein ExbD/TolR [Rubinisphaera brasiliensis DSM 5305]MBR9803731.1 biopolymer transporter ExbD [bacterium]